MSDSCASAVHGMRGAAVRPVLWSERWWNSPQADRDVVTRTLRVGLLIGLCR